MNRKHHKTLVLSDIHLGSKRTGINELLLFLKLNTCDILILNGDIVDGWQFRKGEKWKKKYTRFFRIVLKMMEEFNTEVIYVKGNHDDFLEAVIPFLFEDLWIVNEYIHYSNGRKYLVLHGDQFDPLINRFRWLFKLGLAGFSFNLWLNRVYNVMLNRGEFSGPTLSSLSGEDETKSGRYISVYEQELVSLARRKECQGVICGHIHQPSIASYGDMVYMNSGDWVGSMSALAEDYKGNWNILHFSEEEYC